MRPRRPRWVRMWRSALYCRGSLYAHCDKRVLVVLRFSAGTYDMVKLPPDHANGDVVEAQYAAEAEQALSGLPRDSIFPSAEDGVLLRYASVGDGFRVKVWSLRESPEGGGQLEWTLTHDKDLAAHARMLDMLIRRAPSNRGPLAAEEGRGGSQRKSVWFADEDDGEEAGYGDVGDACSARWNWDDDAGLLDVEPGEDELLDVGAATPSPFSILG
ncbi:hypothetical protein BS78_06G105400 [Paspalum vaginatum]|nr:hypothetical protein BS78_06G105400 [Paspalum vaginatum]